MTRPDWMDEQEQDYTADECRKVIARLRQERDALQAKADRLREAAEDLVDGVVVEAPKGSMVIPGSAYRALADALSAFDTSGEG